MVFGCAVLDGCDLRLSTLCAKHEKCRRWMPLASKMGIGVNWCIFFLALNINVGNYRASGLVGMMSYDDRHIFQADMRQDDLQRLTLKGAVLCAKRSW